jgi:hypothetical protein
MVFSRYGAPGPKSPSSAFLNFGRFFGMFSFVIWKVSSKWNNMDCLGEFPNDDKPSSTADNRILLKLF